MNPTVKRLTLLTLMTAYLGSCSDDAPSTDVEIVETLTEDAANELIEFSDALRKRNFAEAGTYLSARFQGKGYGIDTNKGERVETLSLDVTRRHRTVAEATPFVDKAAFLEDLESLLAPFESIDRVFFKTRGAEFDTDGKLGHLKLTTEIIGRAAKGSMRAVYGWAKGEVVREGDKWLLSKFELERYQITTRPRPIFTDVTQTTGLSHRAPRLGSPGNDKFYWRGAACADVNGDGLYDIFSSAPDRNFLYINRGNGKFEDTAAAAGLSQPIGPTSPLFFDYDNDGDKDLFLGFVGWEDDGAPGGDALHFFENDGNGNFVDASKKLGLSDIRCCAFSALAADFDNDGWLDLYICAYNRLDTDYPDSWHDAKNGNPNLLLRNLKGEGFADHAASFGVASTAWSYAAAAADFDGDGDQDIYVANDYGKNSLYVNQGDGRFVDKAAEMGVLDTGNGMGVAWGDMNNDGKLDIYVSNMSSSAGNRILRRLAGEGKDKKGGDVVQTLFKLAAGNTVFLRDGDGFKRLPPEAGGISASWAWGASLLDIDLDGRLDIYVANGFISGKSLKDT